VEERDARLPSEAVVHVGYTVAAADGVENFVASRRNLQTDAHDGRNIAVSPRGLTEERLLARCGGASAAGLGNVSMVPAKTSDQRIDGLADHAQDAVDEGLVGVEDLRTAPGGIGASLSQAQLAVREIITGGRELALTLGLQLCELRREFADVAVRFVLATRD
jgi:hypothetical protein